MCASVGVSPRLVLSAAAAERSGRAVSGATGFATRASRRLNARPSSTCCTASGSSDQSPAEVHATLLEEQTYLCSTRTMYRVLAEAGEVRERRDQARHPAYAKPELVATAPNQVWVLGHHEAEGGPVAYLYFSLYVILDPLQPLRRRLDGRGARKRAARRAPDRGDVSEAGHRAPPAHHPRPTAARRCAASWSPTCAPTSGLRPAIRGPPREQ